MVIRLNIAFIVLTVTLLVGISGIYLLYSFLRALAPPEVILTKEYISTTSDFINGVTIEKIRVDSIGDEHYPVKYTVTYMTSCNIHHPANKPPEPPDKIEFGKPGKYSWVEESTNVRYVHYGLSREKLDTTNKLWWLNKVGKYPTCPITFEPDQWYFVTIRDPRVAGIYFYIDKSGKIHQHFLPSGVSPI